MASTTPSITQTDRDILANLIFGELPNNGVGITLQELADSMGIGKLPKEKTKKITTKSLNKEAKEHDEKGNSKFIPEYEIDWNHSL